MALRIRFPGEQPPRTTLASYPLTELYLSLHVLSEPGHHVAHRGFVQRTRRRLPPRFRAELAALRCLFGPPLPGAFTFPDVPVQGDAPSAIRALADDESQLAWSLEEIASATCVPKRPAQAEARRQVIAELERDPKAVAQRFAQLLTDYWSYAFEDEWRSLEPQLRLARADAELELASSGLSGFLPRSSPRLRFGEQDLLICPNFPHEQAADFPEDGSLPLVLSLFTAPHVFTLWGPPEEFGLVLPPPGMNGRVISPTLNLVQGLSAIADPTRLTMLRLVAARSRSTRELAQLLSISDSAVSKHLRQLTLAGLVEGRRQGYYVLYRLVPEQAVKTSDAVLQFLDVAGNGNGSGRGNGHRNGD
jgi:DNA-binding transcriptional ArsR family regulator